MIADVPRSASSNTCSVKPPETQRIALVWPGTDWAWYALHALITMKCPAVRERVTSCLSDANSQVGRYAQRAAQRLPD